MSLEIPSTDTIKQKHLDDAWFEEYQKNALFGEISLLNGSAEYRKQQKEEFLSGKVENPTLDYPKLEVFDFNQKEQTLLDLKKKVLTEEKNPLIKQIYRWKLNEGIAQLRALRATRDEDDRKALRYSKFIFGSPEAEIYNHTIFQIKRTVDEKMFSPDPDISSAAMRLNKELFEVFINNENTIDPKEYNIPDLKSTKTEPEYKAEEIKATFEEYLRKNNLEDWIIVVDPETTKILVSQEKKSVSIPVDRKLSQLELGALIEHELGTHALRREKGERSKLHLLGFGLDRYLKGEEGIATYKEQQIKGSKGFRGLDYHFAISLALGIDGKKRDFRKVFEILKDYHFINSKKEKVAALNFARDEAWSDCIRIFRGTTCKTPGACLTRDIVYREGNIGVWDVVKNNPEEVRRFSVGKYDPANPRHIWILEQLGITDEDLGNLEKESKE
jgi:hypothetical protein